MQSFRTVPSVNRSGFYAERNPAILMTESAFDRSRIDRAREKKSGGRLMNRLARRSRVHLGPG